MFYTAQLIHVGRTATAMVTQFYGTRSIPLRHRALSQEEVDLGRQGRPWRNVRIVGGMTID